jgi:hypothetical protein
MQIIDASPIGTNYKKQCGCHSSVVAAGRSSAHYNARNLPTRHANQPTAVNLTSTDAFPMTTKHLSL